MSENSFNSDRLPTGKKREVIKCQETLAIIFLQVKLIDGLAVINIGYGPMEYLGLAVLDDSHRIIVGIRAAMACIIYDTYRVMTVGRRTRLPDDIFDRRARKFILMSIHVNVKDTIISLFIIVIYLIPGRSHTMQVKVVNIVPDQRYLRVSGGTALLGNSGVERLIRRRISRSIFIRRGILVRGIILVRRTNDRPCRNI